MSQTEPFELDSRALGALPIIDRFLERMGVEDALGRYLAPADRRVALPAAVAIGLLVRNLCVAREPLYGLKEWQVASIRGCSAWQQRSWSC